MPTEIKTIPCNDWLDFKVSYSEYLPGRKVKGNIVGSYIFRGLSRDDWGLTSSFDRLFAKSGLVAREKEFAMWIAAFFREISAIRRSDYTDGNDRRVLAFAQHYGMPTRLLDWTRSPYIAAFFAFSDFLQRSLEAADERGDVAVWAVCQPALSEVASLLQLEVLELVDVENLRMRNQDGLFTFLKTDDPSLEAFLLRTGRADECIIKYVIPGTEARTALEDLLLMGIGYKSVFPGFEGIAKSVVLQRFLMRES